MATPPVPFNRLKQIATDVCNNAIGSAEFYDHAKTEQWNSTIISSMLKALISEATPQGPNGAPLIQVCLQQHHCPAPGPHVRAEQVPRWHRHQVRGASCVDEHGSHRYGRQATCRQTRNAQRNWRILGREEGRHVDLQV
ncbi:uncharacterized protein TrAtP1_003204 [Trichoderma atroviride]|uniref:uncharacterized protein n=1 Tax=Hypocrea atroviridis TaxID=63577 RepID=UPI0033328C53|nr:hypothetical protein TrAtP1_003204 [Trichoderma atroviride]